MNVLLRAARGDEIDKVVAFVTAFHAEEGVAQTPAARREAVATLIANPAFGEIRIIAADGRDVGYLAFAYGFSIEFNGRDAFLDEVFIEPVARGAGIGRAAIAALLGELRAKGVKAAHLEVALDNPDAQRLYERAGFVLRRGYHLMSARLDLK